MIMIVLLAKHSNIAKPEIYKLYAVGLDNNLYTYMDNVYNNIILCIMFICGHLFFE